MLAMIAQLAEQDPENNGIKTGIDIDMSGVIPDKLKEVVSKLLLEREWSPVNGVTIESDKPICPKYLGTTLEEEAHFEFPAPVRMKVSDKFILRRIEISVKEIYVACDLEYVKLVIAFWPDVKIKL